MTVISAGVVNKQGRILLSRQFTDISRVRVEGLLSAFPRLLESAKSSQATFIDAGTVRYVYQPLEDYYLVLVTTIRGNIVEDLATLHLMARLIPEYIPEGVTELSLDRHAFEVLFALDEVVVCGKRENVTVEQVRTYLDMDSYEERQAMEVKKAQEDRARKITQEHARELREQRMAGGLGGKGGTYGGISSDDPNFGGFGSSSAAVPFSGNTAFSPQAPSFSATPAAPVREVATAPRSGMSLGKARKTDLSSQIQKEMGLTAPPPPPVAGTSAAEGLSAAPQGAAVAQDGVHVVVQEKMGATLHREGEPTAVDIKGELSVLVSDPQLDHIKLHLAPVSDAFTFRAHAKVNKALFSSDHVIAMSDGKPFPVQQPVTILRWRLTSPTITAPIAFTCWPEAGSITVEYELANPDTPSLSPVRLAIPLYGATTSTVSPSVGDYRVEGGFLVWTIDVVNGRQNSSGNIEVALASEPTADTQGHDVFFPVQVAFASAVSVGGVRCAEVLSTQTGQAVRFSQDIQLLTDGLVIV